MEQYAARNYVPIVKRDTADLLIVLGRLIRPVRILEIGTAIVILQYCFLAYSLRAAGSIPSNAMRAWRQKPMII